MSVIRNIPVEDVVPNPEQPRVEFDHAEIESLAQSIQAHGLIQPIVVEEAQDGYVLVDGERRWRAVRSLGYALIEAKVITFEERRDKFSQAVVANMQRVCWPINGEGKPSLWKTGKKQQGDSRERPAMSGSTVGTCAAPPIRRKVTVKKWGHQSTLNCPTGRDSRPYQVQILTAQHAQLIVEKESRMISIASGPRMDPSASG